jgi:hypothetical protein
MCAAVRLSTLPEARPVSSFRSWSAQATHMPWRRRTRVSLAAPTPLKQRHRPLAQAAHQIGNGAAGPAWQRGNGLRPERNLYEPSLLPDQLRNSSLWRMRSAHRTVTRTSRHAAVATWRTRHQPRWVRSPAGRPGPLHSRRGRLGAANAQFRAGWTVRSELLPLSAVPLGPVRWCHCAASRPGRIPPGACRDCSDQAGWVLRLTAR